MGNSTDSDYYELYQIDDLSFRYDMAFGRRDFIDAWLNENFIEGDDFHFGETAFGTHAFTIYIIFHNIENAVAFKLRWA